MSRHNRVRKRLFKLGLTQRQRTFKLVGVDLILAIKARPPIPKLGHKPDPRLSTRVDKLIPKDIYSYA